MGLLVAYAVQMVVDPRVVTFAGRTEPSEMWVLTERDALRLKVTSQVQEQSDGGSRPSAAA
jgi:hypothetical protein